MFGYVTPLKDELKIKDFKRFKSYYCGLCFHIKEQFGNIPRLALNYDMAFLGLLLDALSEKDVTATTKACIAHPTSKKPVIINNDSLYYASSINIALVYYKLIDDVQDDKNILSKISSIGLSPYTKKFPKEIKLINEVISSKLKELYILENSKNFSYIDEISHPFGEIVGTIIKYYPNSLSNDSIELRNKLYDFGYNLGKWIYIIDALDDLEDDLTKNKFNPINILYNEKNLNFEELLLTVKPRLEFTLLNCAESCRTILSSLSLMKNKDILENIINLGMMDKYLTISNNCKKNKRSDFNNESI